jgi:hypothetical protein
MAEHDELAQNVKDNVRKIGLISLNKYSESEILADYHQTSYSKMNFITSYWKCSESNSNRDSEVLDSGRITIAFPMRSFIGEFLKTSEVRYTNRHLGGFKIEFDDHLEHVFDSYDFHSACVASIAAARALVMMEDTGLRAWKKSPDAAVADRVCDFFRKHKSKVIDHPSYWSVPDSRGKWLILNEPYNEYDYSDMCLALNVNALSAFRLGLYLAGDTKTTIITANEDFSNVVKRSLMLGCMSQAMAEVDLDSYDSSFSSPSRILLNKPRRKRKLPRR